MAQDINYPIGIQTFEEIVKKDYIYVDKTELIYNLVNKNQYVFLSRPRRFGKSLLVSTLEAYFQGRKELFKGLAMENLEKEWKQYPVLRFDLSGENCEHPDKLKAVINNTLTRYEAIYDCQSNNGSIAERFSNLILSAKKHADERVVILIDEYDKALTDNLHEDPLLEDFRKELAGFYGVLKKDDANIQFALLTGITKFGHVSTSSDLNNLNDISLTDDYNAICGVSETEFKKYFAESIRKFAEDNDASEQDVWNAFKSNYDGYHFSKVKEGIYNPFSIMLAFYNKEIGSHWFNSGTPSFLVNAVKRYSFKFEKLEGLSFTRSELCYINCLHALLFQAGYLTIKEYIPATFGEFSQFPKYILGIPNKEVRRAFDELIGTCNTKTNTIDKFVIK